MTSVEPQPSRELPMFSDWPAHAAYIWSRTSLLQQIELVLHATQGWPGVVVQPDSRGLRFLAGSQSLGHLRWDGRLAVPFPAALGERLVAEEMAAQDPDHPSERVVWIVRTAADADRAVWLLQLAYLLSTDDRQARVLSDEPR
jgi:hypothetical protein